jgi:hypothetical protein
MTCQQLFFDNGQSWGKLNYVVSRTVARAMGAAAWGRSQSTNAMSATTIHQGSAVSFWEPKAATRILILHEDFPAYTRAVETCERLLEQFAGELDFDLKTWSCDELTEPDCATRVARLAGAADIILLSLAATETPAALERWLQGHFLSRQKADGALVLILEDTDGSPPVLEALLLRLNRLASRLDMDFIPLFCSAETAVWRILPASNRPVAARVREISFREECGFPPSGRPDHFGLNE